MKKIAFIAFLLIWSVNGWVWGASLENYMPLREGMVWEFQHKFFDLTSKKQISSGKSIKKNLAPMELQGTKVVPQVFSFYQPVDTLRQQTTSFLANDANGLFVFARQSANDKEPKIIPEKYYILKFPIGKGASWKQETEGLILQDTVESTNASIQLPAGTFTNCLVVKKLYFSPKDPNTPLQEVVFWFAPDVGNIKVVMKHPQEHKEILQELVSFKK